MISEGSFLAPASLGGRSVGWRRSDVLAWINFRPPRT
ncbi:AlpA family phage regulatory protein [Rhodobaculum claviforme]|uniref:AlpA family phage regulatory protein n=1 Tax=Rhodobaculum claviforme TaxID=1549854 RepID=A0A934TLQ1_9RHOB|nr:hypothetical protein [Rhodobaculum claviforme]